MSDKVTSLIDYLTEIKNITCLNDEILVFRGHENSEWKIIPSVFRNNIQDFECDVYRSIMVELPNEFKTRSHLSNLVKMQHYGIPTRMLDFSRNPLPAIFFACKHESECDTDRYSDGAVFVRAVKKSEILHHNSDKALMLSCIPCFDDKAQKELKEFCLEHRDRITEQNIQSYNAMRRFIHEIRGEYPSFECEIIGQDLLNGYFVAPYKNNDRIQKQDGLFYLYGLDKDSLDEEKFNKIIIDKSAKEEILKDLKMMGVTKGILYDSKEEIVQEIIQSLKK